MKNPALIITSQLKLEFAKQWLPRGIGPLAQMSGKELMLSTDDSPWIRYETSAGLLPVRLRSIEIDPQAMSWQIKDRESNRVVVCRLDGDDLRMILQKPSLLREAFDVCLMIQSDTLPQR